MTQLAQTVLAGLATGAIYSMVALGFTIVFNATGVTNFANGEFVMMGGLICATLTTTFNWPLPAAYLGAVGAVVLLAAVLDWFGIKRARRKTVLSFAMITIGFSVLYRGLMQIAIGRDILFMSEFGGLSEIRVDGVFFSSQSQWIVLVLAAVSALLSYLFLSTRLGKAMRAASQNPRGAALCGIDPARMALISFTMAGAVGATAGALIAPIGAAFYDYGLVFGLKGFAAAVLGGFGSPLGAVLGGMLIGLAESLSAGYLASEYKEAISLGILLVLLVVRPSGIMGRIQVRRV